MKTFTIRYSVAPTYRKVFQKVLRATDKRQARLLLQKSEGKNKRLQILAVHVSE